MTNIVKAIPERSDNEPQKAETQKDYQLEKYGRQLDESDSELLQHIETLTRARALL